MTLTPISIESWKDVPGYEGVYQVSTEGRVRSLPGWHRAGRVKKLTVSAIGYPVVNMGHNNVCYVHELVALAFLGPRPKGAEICHGDGDPTNNRPENLRYDSHSENERDKIRYGGKFKKLHAVDVKNIRQARDNGARAKDLAAQYGITPEMVWNICTRRSFAWLK